MRGYAIAASGAGYRDRVAVPARAPAARAAPRAGPTASAVASSDRKLPSTGKRTVDSVACPDRTHPGPRVKPLFLDAPEPPADPIGEHRPTVARVQQLRAIIQDRRQEFM